MGDIGRSGMGKILLGFIAAVFAALVILGLAQIGYRMGERKAAKEKLKNHSTTLGGKRVIIPAPKDATLDSAVTSGISGANNLTFGRDTGSGSREVFYFDVMAEHSGELFGPKEFEAFKDGVFDAMQAAEPLTPESEMALAGIAKSPPAGMEIIRDTDDTFTLEHTHESIFNDAPMTWRIVISYSLMDGRLFCVAGMSIAPAGATPIDMPKAIAAWTKAIQFRNMVEEEY